jgi:hypothetical protein
MKGTVVVVSLLCSTIAQSVFGGCLSEMGDISLQDAEIILSQTKDQACIQEGIDSVTAHTWKRDGASCLQCELAIAVVAIGNRHVTYEQVQILTKNHFSMIAESAKEKLAQMKRPMTAAERDVFQTRKNRRLKAEAIETDKRSKEKMAEERYEKVLSEKIGTIIIEVKNSQKLNEHNWTEAEDKEMLSYASNSPTLDKLIMSTKENDHLKALEIIVSGIPEIRRNAPKQERDKEPYFYAK